LSLVAETLILSPVGNGETMAKNAQQSASLQELIAQHQLVQGDPCPAFACELYRTTMYQWPKPVCVRCYPPRGGK